MTTSGTTLFNLEIDDLIDEAISRVGSEHVGGVEAKEARRSLNLLLIDLQNRDIPLSKMEEVNVTVTQSVSEYQLSADIIDILHPTLSRDNTELPMARISLYEFKDLPVKTQQGRPTQYTSYRGRDAVTLKLWPTPENSTDIVKAWVFRKTEDITKSAGQNVDLSTRYLPAIVSGLAYFIARKRIPENTEILTRLRSEYEQDLENATDEDRERASYTAVPYVGRVL